MIVGQLIDYTSNISSFVDETVGQFEDGDFSSRPAWFE